MDCYAGYRGEETPRRLIFDNRQIEVASIQDRWMGPDHRYFKLTGEDGGLYIIRHDPFQGAWQLTCYKTDAGHEPYPISPYSTDNTSIC